MASFNKVILIGHLTADPELKQTTSGLPVTSFSIGVNRRFTKQGEQPQTDFINIVCWRQTAEFVARYFTRASRSSSAARSRPVLGSTRTAISATRPRSSPTKRRLSSASRIPPRRRAASPLTARRRPTIRSRSFPQTTSCRSELLHTHKRFRRLNAPPAWKGWFHYGQRSQRNAEALPLA